MKWKLGLFSKVPLGVISLLPMVVMACKRSAPREEPDPIDHKDDRKAPISNPSGMPTPNTSIPNGLQSHGSFGDIPSVHYNPSPIVRNFLKEIDYKNALTVHLPAAGQRQQHDFSTLIEASRTTDHVKGQSHGLPNTLYILLARDQHKGTLDTCRLVDVASITLRSNPASTESSNHSFALTKFLANVPKLINEGKDNKLVVFLKKDNQWFVKNDDGTETAFNTQQIIQIASEIGTIFVYQKTDTKTATPSLDSP